MNPVVVIFTILVTLFLYWIVHKFILDNKYLKYGALLFVSSPMIAILFLFAGIEIGYMFLVLLSFLIPIVAALTSIALMLVGYYKTVTHR